MADPLTHEVTKTLWPYLRSVGFTKVTGRKFARERNRTFQQIWVDANGVSGKRSTYVIACVSLPFGPVNAYFDRHGRRIANGRPWNMATPETAESSMRQVVEALESVELPWLDTISSAEKMISLLREVPGRTWHTTYSELYRKWTAGEAETMAIEKANRDALKL